MVGGVVAGVVRKRDGTAVLVVDGQGPDAGRERAVVVREVRRDTGEAVAVGVGDRVWWQAGTVMWNPPGADWSGKTKRLVDGRQTYDIELERA
jgi:hypothetical protein